MLGLAGLVDLAWFPFFHEMLKYAMQSFCGANELVHCSPN